MTGKLITEIEEGFVKDEIPSYLLKRKISEQEHKEVVKYLANKYGITFA